MNAERLDIRIDTKTKQQLVLAAEALGVTTASLVRACVKDMLRNGGSFFMLPENLRPTIDHEIENRTKALTIMKKELRDRRLRNARDYLSKNPLPRRSF